MCLETVFEQPPSRAASRSRTRTAALAFAIRRRVRSSIFGTMVPSVGNRWSCTAPTGISGGSRWPRAPASAAGGCRQLVYALAPDASFTEYGFGPLLTDLHERLGGGKVILAWDRLAASRSVSLLVTCSPQVDRGRAAQIRTRILECSSASNQGCALRQLR